MMCELKVDCFPVSIAIILTIRNKFTYLQILVLLRIARDDVENVDGPKHYQLRSCGTHVTPI